MIAESKRLFNLAFLQSFNRICSNHCINQRLVSIVVNVINDTKLEFHLCRKDVPVIRIDASELLCGKLIGLRINVPYIEKMVRIVHYAFVKDLNLQPSDSINLVIYQSQVAECFCIGVVVDKKPVKVLMISDVLEIMEHQFVLQN